MADSPSTWRCGSSPPDHRRGAAPDPSLRLAIAAGLYPLGHSGTCACAIDGVALMTRPDANRQSFTPAALAESPLQPIGRRLDQVLYRIR